MRKGLLWTAMGACLLAVVASGCFTDILAARGVCTGTSRQRCFGAQTLLDGVASDSCPGSGKRVCIAPLGQVSVALVDDLVRFARQEYGLDVGVVRPQAVPVETPDNRGEQVEADALLERMQSSLGADGYDPNVVLIGLTPVDLWWKGHSSWRFAFGVWGGPRDPRAVVSSFRMDPGNFWPGEPDDALMFARARKMFSRYLGTMYYGLLPSDDPSSPMYRSILSVLDLDRMNEALPAR